MFFENYEIELLKKGLAKYYLNQFNQSIKNFNQLLEINPSNRDAYIRRAYALLALGNCNGGIEDLHKAISIQITDRISYEQYLPFVLNGKIKRKIKNKKDLEVIENIILKINESLTFPSDYEKQLWKNAVNTHKKGDKDGALCKLNQLIDFNPEHIDAYWYRAIIKRDLGDLYGADADDYIVSDLMTSKI